MSEKIYITTVDELIDAMTDDSIPLDTELVVPRWIDAAFRTRLLEHPMLNDKPKEPTHE